MPRAACLHSFLPLAASVAHPHGGAPLPALFFFFFHRALGAGQTPGLLAPHMLWGFRGCEEVVRVSGLSCLLACCGVQAPLARRPTPMVRECRVSLSLSLSAAFDVRLTPIRSISHATIGRVPIGMLHAKLEERDFAHHTPMAWQFHNCTQATSSYQPIKLRTSRHVQTSMTGLSTRWHLGE